MISMNELDVQNTDQRIPFIFPPELISTPPDPILDNLIDALRAAMASPKTATLIRHAVERVHKIQGEVALRDIAAHVGRAYRVSIHDLLSPKRTQHLAFCRQVAMYLCRALTKCSFPEIGEYFRRDHSTVIHARNLIAQRMATDAEFRRSIETLRAQIAGTVPSTTAAAA
jgi:chromosomal replication initiator protein